MFDDCAALVFTGSLEEVMRIGALAWLDSDEYREQCAEQVEEWGKTLWSLWKAHSRAGMNSNELFTRVPAEVSALDCWKVWKREDKVWNDSQVEEETDKSPDETATSPPV